MLSSMETIYDVLRLLVSKARGAISDREIDLAHEIISAHEDGHKAAAAAPAPDAEKDPEGSDAEAHG